MPDRCGIRGAGFRIVPFFAAGLLEVLQLWKLRGVVYSIFHLSTGTTVRCTAWTISSLCLLWEVLTMGNGRYRILEWWKKNVHDCVDLSRTGWSFRLLNYCNLSYCLRIAKLVSFDSNISRVYGWYIKVYSSLGLYSNKLRGGHHLVVLSCWPWESWIGTGWLGILWIKLMNMSQLVLGKKLVFHHVPRKKNR